MASTSLLHANTLWQVAFILMVAQLTNCCSCNVNSYRSSEGCLSCASQALNKYINKEHELLSTFMTTKAQVIEYSSNI